MATLTEMDLQKLATIIVQKLKAEFAFKHLSGNLIRTIKVENLGDTINIVIPAPVYDIGEYKSKKVIKYTGKGSYASDLNERGENHKGYVEKIINEALMEWTKSYQNASFKKEEI